MLEMEPKTWPHILQQMSMLVSCRSFDQQVLKQFKSFIIYALCYGSPEVRLSLWNLLIGKLNNVRNQLIIDWLMESLLWQQVINVTFIELLDGLHYFLCVEFRRESVRYVLDRCPTNV